MKTVFKDSILFNGEALKILKKYNNETFDAIITSPPYNTSKRVGATDVYNKRYDKHKDDMTVDNYLDWTISHFNEFEKKLKKDGVILYNMSYGTESHEFSNLIYLTMANIYLKTEFCVADTIVWKKKSAIPNNVSKNKMTRITELIFVIVRKSEYKTFSANKKVKSVSKHGQNFYENVFKFLEASNNDGSNKLNKATYSTELVLELLERDVKPTKETVILDPFHGTGTTANACLQYGCSFVGIEISEEQHNFAVDRLNQTIESLGL